MRILKEIIIFVLTVILGIAAGMILSDLVYQKLTLDDGMHVNMIDTASPGMSWLAWWGVGGNEKMRLSADIGVLINPTINQGY